MKLEKITLGIPAGPELETGGNLQGYVLTVTGVTGKESTGVPKHPVEFEGRHRQGEIPEGATVKDVGEALILLGNDLVLMDEGDNDRAEQD